MLIISKNHIKMHQQAKDKNEALALMAAYLSDEGIATNDYLSGLLARESQTSTYLGQGVAIPHGTPDSRQYIISTGVRFLHFADGVVWNDEGDKAYLLAGIAAKSDEHLSVLKLLTKALNDENGKIIENAKTADEIVSVLMGAPKSFLVHESLIKTQVNAKDFDELYDAALKMLKSQQKITAIAPIPTKFSKLSDDLYCAMLESDEFVSQPALSMAVCQNTLKFQEDAIKAIAVIASNKDVDLQKLGACYDVLLGSQITELINTQDHAGLCQLLGADKVEQWPSASVAIPNTHGLHARPATALSELAKQANGELKVALENGAYVSAKSLTRLLSLGAARGQVLNFIAEPDTDAVDFLPKLIEAVESGLGEEVEPINKSKVTKDEAVLLSFDDEAGFEKSKKIQATSASGGLAVGQAFVVKPVRFEYPVKGMDRDTEYQNLQNAILEVKADLTKIVQTAQKASIAQIFTAHIALLEDEEIAFGAKDGIDEGLSAAAAWHAHIEQMAKTQASLANHVLAERAADLRDIGQKVLAKLTGQNLDTEPLGTYVLIKEDLLPSDVARLDPSRVAGILTSVGGASSHSAIVARALGIPAVVGAGRGVLDIAQGEELLISGSEGWFVVAPSAEQIYETKAAQVALAARKKTAEENAQKPAITKDGRQVEVAANLGNVNDTKVAIDCGAEAVGLLRTELVFMSHQSVPDVATQVEDYKKVFDALDGRPLVVRTLDVGGDKPLPYLPMPHEENPFLGVRGMRLTLKQPKLLEDQLIALIKASNGRDLRIMFPMIGQIEEWRTAQAILKKILVDYPHPKLQVGIMIEVPSAAIMAEAFAKEVDFFSIGTNDLTQYTLAIDRGHATLSKDADGLHPSVLKMIDYTVKAAHAHGKWVGVCGELAGDEKAIPILLGLGVDELSMSARNIALAKEQVRQVNLSDCQNLAKIALQCTTAGEVRDLKVGGLSS